MGAASVALDEPIEHKEVRLEEPLLGRSSGAFTGCSPTSFGLDLDLVLRNEASGSVLFVIAFAETFLRPLERGV